MKEVYGGAYHAGCIYIPEEWVKKNPNTAQAVVNAMVRADRWLRRRRPTRSSTVPPEYYGDDPTLYKVALLKNRRAIPPDGLLSHGGGEERLQGAQAVRALGAGGRNIDLAKTFDNGFAQKALKKQIQVSGVRRAPPRSLSKTSPCTFAARARGKLTRRCATRRSASPKASSSPSSVRPAAANRRCSISPRDCCEPSAGEVQRAGRPLAG